MQDIRGDDEGALATLETMYRIDPRNGGLLKQIAEAHEELGDDEQALAALTTYVDAFPDDATGYASLAALRKRLGDYDGAREDLGTAILMEPLSAAFAAQLARLDLDAGNFAEAGEGYSRALAAARTPAQKADVLDGLKHYHRRRGEVALAVEAMDAWLEEASAVMTPMMLTLSRGDDRSGPEPAPRRGTRASPGRPAGRGGGRTANCGRRCDGSREGRARTSRWRCCWRGGGMWRVRSSTSSARWPRGRTRTRNTSRRGRRERSWRSCGGRPVDNSSTRAMPPVDRTLYSQCKLSITLCNP